MRGCAGGSGADEPALNGGGGGGARAPGGVGAHAQDGQGTGPCPRRGRCRRPRLRAELPAVPPALTAPARNAGGTGVREPPAPGPRSRAPCGAPGLQKGQAGP